PAGFEKSLTSKTKAVILCTPSNPTGSAYDGDELGALLDVWKKKSDAWLIVDEIYADLVYDNFKHVSAAKLASDAMDRIVIIDGVSKTYAMTGWRIGWSIAPERLAKALTPKTKAVLLCTPSNPTGAAYAEANLRALADVLRKHDCWIIVDEIYAELVYDGFKHVSMAHIAPDLAARTIVIDGVSKTYAMTGWRIGWTIAPKEVVQAIDLVQGQSTTNATAIAQHAAVAALTGPQNTVEDMRKKFERRRDVMVAGLNEVPGVRCRKPEGAFYAFADCRGMYGIMHGGKPIASDDEVAFFLLDEAHVAAVPGGAFGAPGYVRFSYATSEERIEAGLESMRRAISNARRA
ncbi:MAG TPA: aminotransferase class I/II-fold pyridoxal phosphate-dependent enzyme, partial [Polyangiaceae bacterium]